MSIRQVLQGRNLTQSYKAETRKEAMEEIENATDRLDGTIPQPKTQLKNHKSKKEKFYGLIDFLRLFIILIFLIQVDNAEGRNCRDDQHEIQKGNQFDSCRDCPSCVKGFGLTPTCGNIINIDTVVECKECVLGVTYSKYHGTDSCHPCTECSPGQVIKTECTLTTNRECDAKCKSKDKYYAGNVKHDCQNCSWCCGTSSDQHQQECIDKGMPKNKQCSINQALRCWPSTTPPQPLTKKNDQSILSPKTSQTTTTTIQPKPTSLPKKAPSSSHPSDGGGTVENAKITLNAKLLVGILLVVSVVSIALIIAGLIWCKWYRNSSLNDCCGTRYSDEKVRKAEEGQSQESESTDDHDIRETKSDIRSDERGHGSNPQYREVERQGSVDEEGTQPVTNGRQLRRHGTVVKWSRRQQSTEELLKEPTDSCKEVEIGIDAGHEAKSTTQFDKRRLSQLCIVAEFQDICQLLECKPETLSPCGDYKDVAGHYSMPYHSICALERESTGPAHALITWLETRQPRLTVEEFAVPLTTKTINRPDVVRILREYYYCN